MATAGEYDSTDINNLRKVYRYACFSYIAIYGTSTAKGNPSLSTNTEQSFFSHTTKYISISITEFITLYFTFWHIFMADSQSYFFSQQKPY